MIPASFDIEVGLIVHEGRVDPTAFVPAGVAPGTPILFAVAAIHHGLVWLLPADDKFATPNHTIHIEDLRANWTVVRPVDTSNWALVSSNGSSIGILNLGYVADMTPDSALTVAAWLVTLADPLNERFPQVLEAVRSS